MRPYITHEAMGFYILNVKDFSSNVFQRRDFFSSEIRKSKIRGNRYLRRTYNVFRESTIVVYGDIEVNRIDFRRKKSLFFSFRSALGVYYS